jgi:hypothetical protein
MRSFSAAACGPAAIDVQDFTCDECRLFPASMGRGFVPVAMVLPFIAGSGGVQGEDRSGSPANPGRILKSRRRHVLIKLNAEVACSFKDISGRNCCGDVGATALFGAGTAVAFRNSSNRKVGTTGDSDFRRRQNCEVDVRCCGGP